MAFLVSIGNLAETMVYLDNNSVDKWLQEADAFCSAFMEYSFSWHHPVGADIQLLADEIKRAHSEWAAICHEWRTQNFRQEAASLSYTKTFGVLLWTLSKTGYCGEMREYEPFRHPRPEFNGTETERKAVLDDLLGAPEIVTALQFCLSILIFFETNRIDRETDFIFHMTESWRHDLIMSLAERRIDALGTYLALDAVFARR